MPVLWHGDRAICVLAILTDDRKKTYNFFRGGRDEGFKGPSPGLMLHAYAIRHAIANGITKYDFLRGNEPYKYSFGAREDRLLSLILSTRNRRNLGGTLDVRSTPIVLQRGYEQQRANRLAEAERAYRQVLDATPHDIKALHLLGQVAAKQGDHLTAVKQFRLLVSLRPDMAVAWYELAKSLQARGAWVEAADAYCEVARREATHPQVYRGLGQVLLKLDQVDHAIAAFEAALGLRADYADAIIGRSEALQIRDTIPPAKAAQRALRYAAVGERVGRVDAIAAAARRLKEATIVVKSNGPVAGGVPLGQWRRASVGPLPGR
jgi:predicted Zn-dependent protease